jgi:4-amino-4-deoxy-L-arabinose transferase-like glycosyltransferase
MSGWLHRWEKYGVGAILWLGIVSAAVLRLRYGQSGPAQWDDVDFVLALQRYDLAAMQPHFPGYPVYVLAGMLLHAWIGEPYRTLAVLSALSSGATVGLLYLAVRPWFGRGLALAAAWLYGALPLTWVLGTQAMSDAFGALVATALAAACVQVVVQETARKKALWLLAAGTLYGLLLGVRSSYIALGVLPVWAGVAYLRVQRQGWKDVAAAVLASALVCVMWVYAMVVNSGGWLPFWQMATSFTEGHFSDWGGTYSADQPVLARLYIWTARQVLGAGFGTPWGTDAESPARWISAGLLAISLTGLLIAALRKKQLPLQKEQQTLQKEQQTLQREHQTLQKEHQTFKLTQRGIPLFQTVTSFAKDRRVLYLLLWLLPYAVWAFFAQNVEKPRHVLPMMAPLCVGAVWGLRAWGRIVLTAGTVGMVLAMSFVGLSTVAQGAQVQAPAVQLTAFLQAEPQNFIVFTYEEERVIHYLAPAIQTIRLRRFEDFQTAVLNHPHNRLLLTDSVLRGFRRPELEALSRPLASFHGNQWLYPTYHDITLYELPAADGQLIKLFDNR